MSVYKYLNIQYIKVMGKKPGLILRLHLFAPLVLVSIFFIFSLSLMQILLNVILKLN